MRPPAPHRDFHGFVAGSALEGWDDSASGESATVTQHAQFRRPLQDIEGFPFPYRVEAEYGLDASGPRAPIPCEQSRPRKTAVRLRRPPLLSAAPGQARHTRRVPRPRPGRLGAGPARRSAPRSAPTSEATPSLEGVCPPVPEALDLRSPKPFIERTYNGLCTTSLWRTGAWRPSCAIPSTGSRP